MKTESRCTGAAKTAVDKTFLAQSDTCWTYMSMWSTSCCRPDIPWDSRGCWKDTQTIPAARDSSECCRKDMSTGSTGAVDQTRPEMAQAGVGKTRLDTTVWCRTDMIRGSMGWNIGKESTGFCRTDSSRGSTGCCRTDSSRGSTGCFRTDSSRDRTDTFKGNTGCYRPETSRGSKCRSRTDTSKRRHTQCTVFCRR